MKKIIRKSHLPLSVLFLFLLHLPFGFAKSLPENIAEAKPSVPISTGTPMNTEMRNEVIYDSLQLDTLGLSKQAFIEASKGYQYLRSEGKLNNDEVLSIVDFSLPSSEKRLFVIDMANLKVLYNTYVAHGRNSGREYARHFSNSPKSNMSSIGFFITQGTYFGEHGLSLRLEGEEKGINDNAASRAIVVHCADYVNEKMAKTLGYIGRSLGCPALSKKYAKPIIQTIKDGSCFFVYSPSEKYKSQSSLLKQAS
ncbi:MAG: murein L,D-transpeptidase catalytic domain family protein [Ginsengibacter sp.]